MLIKLLCPTKMIDGAILPAGKIIDVSNDLAQRMTDGKLAQLVEVEEPYTAPVEAKEKSK